MDESGLGKQKVEFMRKKKMERRKEKYKGIITREQRRAVSEKKEQRIREMQ